MLLGYNTNGLSHHDMREGLAMVADLGYQSVALTLDHGWLNPYSPDNRQELRATRRLLTRLGLRSVIETGARFLLDPRHKHEPTLVSPGASARKRRVDFLKRAIDAAARLESDCVSLWSGAMKKPLSETGALARLVAGLREVLDYADSRGVMLGFEPEPGMLIDTLERFHVLRERLAAPHFKLTLDIGHLHCQGELPLAEKITRGAPWLVNVHLEDMRRGVHEHLMFGEGEISFEPVLEALECARYAGGVHVELSRHSHLAPEAARQARDFLKRIWPKPAPRG
jgi:sugar phosphate isomerase/epimerase